MAKREWSVSIHGLGERVLDSAFERIKRSGAKFPPSLPEFLSYCKPVDSWEHKGGAYKLHTKALPKPVNRAAGRAALAGLRAVL